MNTTIYIQGKGYLDIDPNQAFPLNYSVADIEDISKKNGAYSKTITLPSSKTNNNILGQLFNINVADSSFDFNHKAECKVISNDVVVLDGYLKLNSVNKSSETSIQGDQVITYDITVFDTTSNLFDDIDNKLLEDLDLSRLNHLYSGSTILSSSGYTHSNGFTYHMLYNTNTTSYSISDFFPAIYAKTYLDAIFQEAGYSYESDFLNGLSEDGLFTKLIIPFNQERPINSSTVINSRKFHAGYSGSTTQSITSNFSSPYQLEYNDDINGDYFDSGNTYTASASTYTSPANQLTDIRVRVPIQMTYSAATDGTLTYTPTTWGTPPTDAPKFKPFIQVRKNGVNVSSVLVGTYNAPVNISAGTNTINSVNIDVTIPNINLTIGDDLTFHITPSFYQSSWWEYQNGGTPVDVSYQFDILKGTGATYSVLNIPHTSNITDGDTVFINDYIPKNVKQKDFLKWLLQMFNLYIEKDKDNDNKLIIKTRDEYYDNNNYVDWTNKINPRLNNKIDFLAKLQNRDLKLSYKNASDEWSKKYSENWKESYGQKKFTFDNDFLTGEKKIEVGFETTPLVYNGFNLIVPAIPSDKPKTGIKVLYKPDDWVDGDWLFKYRDGATEVTDSLDTYPYAGHFDNPNNPQVDINFGQCRELYYWQFGNITENTLGELFYQNYVQQLIDGKLFTAYFDLNEVDITNLDFSKRIFIKDTYYYLNKVVDYTPTNNAPTKVELIKVDAPLKFKRRFRPTVPSLPTTLGNIVDSNPVRPSEPSKPHTNYVTNNVINNWSTTVDGEGNTAGSNTSAKIVGNNNTIFGDSTGFIVGDSNELNGGKSLIIGNNNQTDNQNKTALIYGDNNIITGTTSTMVFGDNNSIQADKSIVFGNNLTATTSGIYAENIFVTGQLTVDGVEVGTGNYVPVSGGTFTGDIMLRGKTNQQGALIKAITSVNTSSTLSDTVNVVFCIPTLSADVTTVLPISASTGMVITFKRTDTTSYEWIIAPNTGQDINYDGSIGDVVLTPNNTLKLIYDGSYWHNIQ